MHISALIVAEGACPDIHLCIGSAKDVSTEVIIVDIGIAPAVKSQIARAHPEVVFHNMPKPEYVELIRQQTFEFATHPWILLLDPDEYLSPGLVTMIKQFDHASQVTHFKIPRQNYIFGKWISHSRWWPDYQVRLFRKDSIEWPTTLHAQPILRGEGHLVGAFEEEKLEMNASAIVHHNYTTIGHYLEKALRYARVEADEIVAAERTYTLVDACKKGTGEFVSRFFADRGYKDGVHGFLLAFLQLVYAMLVFMFVWEKNGYAPVTHANLLRATHQLFVVTSKEMYYWLRRLRLVKGVDVLLARLRGKML
jgi:(heptosyl)LPS beta-1,4-glucosyltransferase